MVLFHYISRFIIAIGLPHMALELSDDGFFDNDEDVSQVAEYLNSVYDPDIVIANHVEFRFVDSALRNQLLKILY